MQTVVSPRSNHPNRINIGTSFRKGNDIDRHHGHGPAGKIIQASSSFLVGTDCWHDSFASLKQNSANKDFGDWSSVDFEDDCFSFSDSINNKNEQTTNNKSAETIAIINPPTTSSTSSSHSTIVHNSNEKRRKKGKQNDSQLLRRASNSSSRRKKETKKGSSSKTKTNSEDTDISAPPPPPADIRNRRSRFQQAGQQQQPQISTRSLKSIARSKSIPNKKESDSSSLDKKPSRTSSKDTNIRRKTISSSSSHRQKEDDESSSLEEENRKEKSTHRRHCSLRNSRRGSSLVKNTTVVEMSPKRSFSAGSNEHNDTIDELHRLLNRRRRKPKGINSEESSKRTGKKIADVVKAPPLTKLDAEEVKSDHARPPSTVAYEGDTPTLPTRSQSMGSNSARHHHHDAVPRRSGRKGSSHRGSRDNGPRDRDPDRVDSNEHRERRRTSRRRNGTTAAKKHSDHVETEMRDFLEHMSW